jgi:septal ring factor EnvC (AmiA/AmiB activator)
MMRVTADSPCGRARRRPAALSCLFAIAVVVATTAGAQCGSGSDAAVDERLNQLEADIARLKQEAVALRAGQSDTSEELGHIRAGLANATIGLESLRSSIDGNDLGRRHAIADFARRIERLEHQVAASDRTGSIAPAPVRRSRHVVPGWSVQEAQDGQVLIADDRSTFWVRPGTTVPGLGRVSNVRQRASHWVVVTEKGVIAQR